jgi:hypothetical protein
MLLEAQVFSWVFVKDRSLIEESFTVDRNI